MIKEYLNNRKNKIYNTLKEKKEQYEHNQISIVETKNKILELNNMVDEASEMFSVKAREDSGFKNQEVRELETKIAVYVSENLDLEKVIHSAKKEIKNIEECLEELKQRNVSRETFLSDNKLSDKKALNSNEITAKLQFIKKILTADKDRAILEIDELLKRIKQ